MKTKCMSCGGTMKKLQNSGLPKARDGQYVRKEGYNVAPTPREVVPSKTGGGRGPVKAIKKVLKKLTPRKNTGCFGAGGSKMQNGGMIPKCPGPNCPRRWRPETGPIKAIKKVIKKITRPKITTDTPYGNFPKDMSQPQTKMQKGGYPVKNFINNKLKPIFKIPRYPGERYPKKDPSINGYYNGPGKDPRRKPKTVLQNGGTTEPSENKIERNKIKQTGPRKFLFQNQSPSRGTRSKEVTLDQNLYDPNKNSGAVTKTIRNNAGEIIKQKTRIVSNAKAQKKYDKILKSTAKKTNTCFSGNCK